MRLRFWVCAAKSGNVLGEVRVSGGSTLTSRFGGGTCSLTVSLGHLTTRDGLGVDLAAAGRVLDWLTVGRSTILVTSGTRVIGEWIVMKRGLVAPSGTVPITGMEWAGYPALRSLNTNFLYNGTEQMVIARAAWDQAFKSFNTGMTITIPSSGSTGVVRSMSHLSHEAYYSDVLEEIGEADDGFEWHVDISATWSNGVPTKATRTIVWGHPTLSRSSSLTLSQSSPGGRQGNLVDLSGGEDFARYAQSVYGFGAGEGEKRFWVGLSDPSGTNAGNLNSTKNVSFPGIEKESTLTALTRAELKRSQDLRDPFAASALIEKLPSLPVVGNQVRLRVDPTWTYPTGLNTTLRVGQVEYSPTGHEVDLVKVLAA